MSGVIRTLTVYYDIGTTNMRAYLLNEGLELLACLRKALGAKDSAIAGSNRGLLLGMKELYRELLAQTNCRDEEVYRIYASGMATSPYGIAEISHFLAPVTIRDFARYGVTPFREETVFGRELLLISGLRTTGEDISSINNTRGEEIEVLGVLPKLEARFPGKQTAVILPGSHTHVLLAGQGKISGILSNFTGELFYALKENTILSPVLETEAEHPDPEAVRLGLANVQRYGFNRALYIGHAMRIFEDGTPQDRRSYCEAVISGGVITALDAYCRDYWKGCDTAVVVANPHMCELFELLLLGSRLIRVVDSFVLGENESAALEGLRQMIRIRKEDHDE